MENKKPEVGVGILIFNAKGEVLLGLRRGMHESDIWGAPGGRVAFGESLAHAAIREVREETGIALEKVDFISVADDTPSEHTPEKHFVSIGFRATTATEPTVVEPEKCSEWRWFSLDALPEKLFFPTVKMLESVKRKQLYVS